MIAWCRGCSRPVTMRRTGRKDMFNPSLNSRCTAAQLVGEPVGDVVAGVGHVVGVPTCSTPPSRSVKIFSSRNRRIDELIVALLRIVERDLAILGPMRHAETARGCAPCDAIQVHLGRAVQELLHVARTEGPHDVRPVVRHGVLALALEALVLHLCPSVVGAPDRAPAAKRGSNATARGAKWPPMTDALFNAPIRFGSPSGCFSASRQPATPSACCAENDSEDSASARLRRYPADPRR